MRKIILSIIFVIAIVLRFWQLGGVPPSPDWDEAALGYNAYSIMQTGTDEYGTFLPIVLRSFDDYKPALYVYLTIPSIKLFGLNTFAVRLPSAVFGVLTVVATYFLVKELFKRWDIAALTAFLLAISPWHLQFSRIAFESNIGFSLNVFTVLFFLWSFKKSWFLVVSAILMGLNLYVYQSEKVFVPLLLLSLVLIFRKDVFALSKKYIVYALVSGFIISLPMILFILTSKEALTRAQGVSIFADQTPFLKENVERLTQDARSGDVVGLILDNRRIVYAKTIISGYLSHFDLNWLFVTGDLARHHAPGMGLMYLWELPFLLVGIYMLLFSSEYSRKTKILILIWFLLAPIPASITSGVPHAVRTLNFLPTFQVFTAIGVIFAAQRISNIKYQRTKIQIKNIIFFLFVLFFIFNFSYFLDQYFIQQKYFYSQDWQYGYEEAISEVRKIESAYDRIIVSNKPHLDQSYMFFLFYLGYPPSLYQMEAKNISGGFQENHKFGKYEFRPIGWGNEKKDGSVLYVGRPEDFPENANILKTIFFLDGQPAIKIVEG